MKVDWLIVGSGFTGATLAERLATQRGQKVLVVDRRAHIGGNAYDEYNEHGILTHRYGPHIFHTNAKHVWDYLSQFTEWRPYYHRVLAVVNGQTVPLPFNLNSIYQIYPPLLAQRLEQLLVNDYGFGTKVPILKLRESSNIELRNLAAFVYDKVFLGYTLKQWDLKPDDLDPSVTGRVPIYISRDDRYFQDTYQGLPSLGYTQLFRNMLSHRNIHLLLNTDYSEVVNDIEYKRMIYTGPIDSFFGYAYGQLPYRSLRFDFRTVDGEQFQPVGTVNYPSEYDFTRVTEQKHLTGQQSSKTTLVTEFPQAHQPGVNEPYYPIPREENRELYTLYEKEAAKLEGKVLFAGRLAEYQYYNMDQVVARALTLFNKYC